MGEGLAHLRVVEGGLGVVEEEIVGAKVALVRVVLFGEHGVILDQLEVGWRDEALVAPDEVEFVVLVGRNLRVLTVADDDQLFQVGDVGALVIRIDLVNQALIFSPFDKFVRTRGDRGLRIQL